MDMSFNQSCSSFYRKIINKYRKGRSNSFIFPILIFKKNSENALKKKIGLDFLFTLHIHNKKSTPESKINVVPFQYADELQKTLKTISSSILWKFQKTPGKDISQKYYLKRSVNIIENSSDSVKEKEIRMVEHTASVLKQIFIPFKNVFSYQNTVNNVSYGNTKTPQIFANSYYNNFYPQMRWIKNHSGFTNKNIQVPSQVNKPLWGDKSLPNKNMMIVHGFQSNNILPNREITDPHLMKFNNNVPVSEPSGSAKEKYSFNINSENLHYQDNGQIKQEIEEIKRIIMETKESVKSVTLGSAGYENVKPKLDINRISDQVYQNIERHIRMERERRGM